MKYFFVLICFLFSHPTSFAKDAKEITPKQAQEMLDLNDKANKIVQKSIKKYGHTQKAKEDALSKIKKIPGVKNAVITQSGDISYKNNLGIILGVSISKPGTR